MELELPEFEKRCVALLDGAPKRRSRHCFRSAIYHLDRAQAIRTIDPAMAMFRAITAEEEAASGLMHCLKEVGFENAEMLKPKNHFHKNSVSPFFNILGLFHGRFLKENEIKPALHIKEEDGKRRLTIAIPIVVNSESILAYPVPPLNFGVSIEEKAPSYKKQISDYVAAKGGGDIVAHLREEANLRNRILYASGDGYPVVKEISPEFMDRRKAIVLAFLKAYLFIFPYTAIEQPFVQNALDAYLAMLGTLEKNNLHDEV